MVEDLHQSIPGERAQTSTDGSAPTNPTLRRGAVAAAIVAFIAFGLWSMRSGTTDPSANQLEHVVIRQTADFEPARDEPRSAQPVPEVRLPTPALSETAIQPEKDELMESARRAPVMAFGSGQSSIRGSNDENPDVESASPYMPANGVFGEAGASENDGQRFGRLLAPTPLKGSRAGYLGNRNYIIAMGTSIPCILETALSSDQPGFTSCIVNRDILSDNGRVVLLDKGTQVVGEYRGGLRRGQNRLFVLWNRAKTPTGVIVTLASPATDALGRAGFDGYVDSHWWERFGSALLLSIVGDLTSYAASQLQDKDVDAQGATSTGNEAAAIAVEQSINIPPTLTTHQGALVSIFVARDLDFSGIYALRVTEPRSTISDRAVLGDFRRHETPATK